MCSDVPLIQQGKEEGSDSISVSPKGGRPMINNKLFIILLASLLISSLAGCGGNSASADYSKSGDASGLITLTWDAPTTNIDGSSLNPVTDLTTYKIYYGSASQAYTQVATITNPGTLTITQTFELPAGTYYFAVTTVDNSGTESDYSNEVIKNI